MIAPSETLAEQRDDWLDRFHAGDPDVLAACYQDHFEGVEQAIAGLVRGADRETVIHEVFFRLATSAPWRSSFQGGSLAAWLGTVARNLARDHLRRQRREATVPIAEADDVPEASSERQEDALQARLLVERFRREVLPAKWDGVFVARFLEQRDQRDAAASLGIPRTTLAYQEFRIRRLLRRFVLEGTR